jgi:nucleoside phosphorylase
VVQYDLGRETTEGFERKGFLESPPKEWRNAIVEMKTVHRVEDNKIEEHLSEMLRRYPRLEEYQSPGAKKDILFQSDNVHVLGQTTCERCDLERMVTRTGRDPGGPAIFYGLIASGDRVMKNAAVRDKISADSGGVLCFEMEAAGLMHDFQCVVIRGIADYADSHKNDD